MTLTRRRFPSWPQALITFGAGIVLAFTSCVGFFTSMYDSGSAVTTLSVIGFIVGALCTLVGFIFCVIRAVRRS